MKVYVVITEGFNRNVNSVWSSEEVADRCCESFKKQGITSWVEEWEVY